MLVSYAVTAEVSWRHLKDINYDERKRMKDEAFACASNGGGTEMGGRSAYPSFSGSGGGNPYQHQQVTEHI